MKRESSSDNGSSCNTSKISKFSKNGSNSKASIKYICFECSKEFTNGQALGGHQNAHRIERTIRTQLPGILETILTKQPAAFPQDSSQMEPLATVIGGGWVSHSPHSPETVVVNASDFNEIRDRFRHWGPRGYLKVNPRARARNALPPRYRPFGSRENDHQLQGSDSERTNTAPIVPVSRTNRVPEGEVNSERNGGVDLELRLGFGA
ncbi:hypothetical protein K2173_005681 [Erythroxylum novogranatense]|uniref:C2H2-type domain-containing protein n=1 Tax=Erythroxylum novogranatense TaxID=1862640 RepID=A0AAV8SR60_9ROSI|nr:hypothetical protein K2173_005681 [Erythroxylum novogranatense]